MQGLGDVAFGSGRWVWGARFRGEVSVGSRGSLLVFVTVVLVSESVVSSKRASRSIARARASAPARWTSTGQRPSKPILPSGFWG